MVSTRRQIERQHRQNEIKDLKDVKTPPDLKRKGKRKAQTTLHKQATVTAATAVTTTPAASQAVIYVNGDDQRQQHEQQQSLKAPEVQVVYAIEETQDFQDAQNPGPCKIPGCSAFPGTLCCRLLPELMARVTALEQQVRDLKKTDPFERQKAVDRDGARTEQATQTTPAGGLFGRLRAGLGNMFSPRRTPAEARTIGLALAPSVKRRLSASDDFRQDAKSKRARILDATNVGSSILRDPRVPQTDAPSVRFSNHVEHAPEPHTPAQNSHSNLLSAPSLSKSVPANPMAFTLRKRIRTRALMEEELRNESARKQGFLPPMTEAQIRHRAILDRDYAIIETKYPSFRVRPENSSFEQLTTRGDLTEDNLRNQSAPLPSGPPTKALGKRKMPDTPAEDFDTPTPKRTAMGASTPAPDQRTISSTTPAPDADLKSRTKRPHSPKDVSMTSDLFSSGDKGNESTPKLPFTPNPTGTYACPLFSDSSDEEEDEVKTPTASQPIPTPTPTQQNQLSAGTLFGGNSNFTSSTSAAEKPVSAPPFSFQPATSAPTLVNGLPISSPLFSPHNAVAALTPISEESSSTSNFFLQKAAPATAANPAQPSFKPIPPSTSLAPSSYAPHSADFAPSAPNYISSSNSLFTHAGQGGFKPASSTLNADSQGYNPIAPAGITKPAIQPTTVLPDDDTFPKDYFATQDEWQSWVNEIAKESLKDAGVSVLEDPALVAEAMNELTRMARDPVSLAELFTIGEEVGIGADDMIG